MLSISDLFYLSHFLRGTPPAFSHLFLEHYSIHKKKKTEFPLREVLPNIKRAKTFAPFQNFFSKGERKPQKLKNRKTKLFKLRELSRKRKYPIHFFVFPKFPFLLPEAAPFQFRYTEFALSECTLCTPSSSFSKSFSFLSFFAEGCFNIISQASFRNTKP